MILFYCSTITIVIQYRHNTGGEPIHGKDNSPPSTPTPLAERNGAMAIVTEYDWEGDTWTHHSAEHAARAAWRAAVAEIAAMARAKLPECNGRIDRAE